MSSHITPDAGMLVIESALDVDLVNPVEAALYVKGGQYLGSNLYVNGTLVVNGDVVSLGNGSGSLTFNSNISSDVIPATDTLYNLGSGSNKWKTLYVQNISLDSYDVTTDISTSVGINNITGSTNNTVGMIDGNEGEFTIINVVSAPAFPVTVTPTNPNGFTSILLTNSGDSITMLFNNGKWNIVSNFRCVLN